MDSWKAFAATYGGAANRTESGEPSDSTSAKSKGKSKSGASGTDTIVTCEICGQEWPVDQMRHHIGAHILLQDEWSKHHKVKPKRPCGLCGVRETLGQIVADSAFESEQCCVSITEDKKWPIFECKHLGEKAATKTE